MKIPLHNREGQVVAFATVDDEDEALTKGYRWYKNAGGYVVANLPNGKSLYLHRHLAGRPGFHVDHENGDQLNNRRTNIRCATVAQNMQNRVRLPVNNTSGFRGVVRRGSRWGAMVKLNGRQYSAGRFDTPEEADIAARAFRAEHMPFSEDARAIGRAG